MTDDVNREATTQKNYLQSQNDKQWYLAGGWDDQYCDKAGSQTNKLQ